MNMPKKCQHVAAVMFRYKSRIYERTEGLHVCSLVVRSSFAGTTVHFSHILFCFLQPLVSILIYKFLVLDVPVTWD